jgi:ATP-binding cassette subfamily B protein
VRAAIGMVPQDTVLFANHLPQHRYGRWEATTPSGEAARLCQIVPSSGFRQGLRDRVGERGLKLSGGEKRRSRSAHDSERRRSWCWRGTSASAPPRRNQDALDRVSKYRTTLVIAHRLSTIVAADEIIVLDQGVIVERGTHQALLAKGGLYASMWNRQREAEAAREKLAEIGDEVIAPNRNPPTVEEVAAEDVAVEDVAVPRVHAAE